MKKNYQNPKFEKVVLNVSDVMSTSTGTLNYSEDVLYEDIDFVTIIR